ncbi:MAG: hypothetical protein KDE55_21165, partial [Novosphingobium sp.]|nr:hypothetical protein [Novosphingobium sp.]
HDTELERKAQAWMDDPLRALGLSNTQIHSVPRDEAEAIQLVALNRRLEQRRQQIETLAKLADAQGISQLSRLADAAPLLFAHDVYKSYPVSLLAKQKFDRLTRWLDRLTPYDLSGFDPSGCGSIDEWLVRMREETPLDVATSSGTSGTMSFFPKSRKDYLTSVTMLRIQLTQVFGTQADPADLNVPFHVLTPFYNDGHSTVSRLPAYFLDVFCKGDPDRLHTALPYKASADLMWLASRLKAAQAKGDTSRVDVPENLLARRAEWEKLTAEMPALQSTFIREMVPQLSGEHVAALGITGMFYEIARAGLEAGTQASFASGSAVMGGGGGKGIKLPDDAEQVICRFFGVPRMQDGYGMTEQNFYLTNCEHDRFHMPPWVTVLLLDPETGQPLPRKGEQVGRAAFFDMTQDGAWGGIVTGDRISASFDPCPCGRSTLHLGKKIQRFSEFTGEDDKLTCAATPAAQEEALGFLTSL